MLNITTESFIEKITKLHDEKSPIGLWTLAKEVTTSEDNQEFVYSLALQIYDNLRKEELKKNLNTYITKE